MSLPICQSAKARDKLEEIYLLKRVLLVQAADSSSGGGGDGFAPLVFGACAVHPGHIVACHSIREAFSIKKYHTALSTSATFVTFVAATFVTFVAAVAAVVIIVIREYRRSLQ